MKKPLKRDLTEIAKKHLHIDTLRQRFSDDLDFHDVSAWGVEAALTAAYEIGYHMSTDPKAAAAAKAAAKEELRILKIDAEARETAAEEATKEAEEDAEWCMRAQESLREAEAREEVADAEHKAKAHAETYIARVRAERARKAVERSRSEAADETKKAQEVRAESRWMS
jgi:hypothetical protein